MKLHVLRDESLPPLAWCARVRRGGESVELLCGVSVDVRGDAFFEGAWADDFESFDFIAAADVFGSGGRIVGDELLVVNPSHTLERVQYLQRGGETLISNSLVFLLAAAGAQLDPNHAGYANDFTRVIRYGLEGFDTPMPTRGGGPIHLVYLKNLHVHRDGRITFSDKPPAAEFDSFERYVEIVAEALRKTIENGAAPARETKYAPLASVSTGYDSPAVATLVRRAGCSKAVTLTRARADGSAQVEDDSGKPIAEALGYELKEFDRETYRNGNSFPEAEFLATGMSGEDVNMLAFETELRRSVFFTGFHGDRIWDMHAYPDELLRRKDMSGASMTEFRLRVDFVHVPAVFVAARRHPKILEIGNSAAMKQWSIGTDYDRPIARRIAEEAGVPRKSFGQAKRATTALLHLHGGSAWSPATREAVIHYAQRAQVPLTARLGYAADAFVESSGYFMYRALRKLKMLSLAPSLARKPMGIHSHTRLGPLPMLWAIEKVQPRYTEAAKKLRG